MERKHCCDNDISNDPVEHQVAEANRRWRLPFRCRGSRHEPAVAQFATLRVMKSIASLEVDIAAELLERLKTEAIPFQVQTATQEGGLDYSEVMVEDSYYDRACDVAEAWEASRLAEAERRSRKHCPRCGSSHLEYSGAESFSRNVWKCKDCGNDFAR
jgi:hypothetical protein